MECPLTLNLAATVGATNYYAPCGCVGVCELASCKYTKCGVLVTFTALDATGTNTVYIVGKKCGASAPVIIASTGAIATNAGLTAGTIYKIYPQTINGVLRFVVADL